MKDQLILQRGEHYGQDYQRHDAIMCCVSKQSLLELYYFCSYHNSSHTVRVLLFRE